MRKFASIILVVLMLSSMALAHGGGTDSKGGHMNHSTGEYHYHHGYPAHDHVDGVCPYDNKDKSGQNSSSSSSSSSGSSGSSSSSTGTMDYYRTTANVNMRSSASGSASIIATIPADTRVKYMGSHSGNWIQVSYSGQTGWCHADYLVKIPKGAVATKPVSISSSFATGSYFQIETSVNMRLEPSQTSKMITTIPKGATVEYISTYDDWAKVYYNYNAGYVLSKYLVGLPGSNNSQSEPVENTFDKHESNKQFWKIIGVTPLIIINGILAGAGIIICALMGFFIIREFVEWVIGIFKKD